MSHEVDFLIERLRWPVAAARWWAMQELAELLRSPALRARVQSELCDRLRGSKLEAEAVELLCVFWMAFVQGVLPPPDLAEHVARQSVLATTLLEAMGLQSTDGFVPPLQVVPANFELPDSFRSVQGRDVPRIYLTILRNLEEATDLPFTRQAAYEWACTESLYPDAPLQGDLAFFVRAMGEGATGSFANRAGLRMLTAFQRTLEVAESTWRMPRDVVRRYAYSVQPLEPSLAFMRSRRPAWVPPLGDAGPDDIASIERFIRQAREAIRASDPADELLALSTPVKAGVREISELSLVRWKRMGPKTVDPEALWRRFEGRQGAGEYGQFLADGWSTKSRLSTVTLDQVQDEEAHAVPMAAVQNPSRVAYLHKEFYPKRLYLPVATGLMASLVLEPAAGMLSVSARERPVASLAYWNAGWAAAHPAALDGGLWGTALVGKRANLVADDDPAPSGYFYLWKFAKLTRDASYTGYQETTTSYGIELA